MQWLFALGYMACYAPYAYLTHRAAGRSLPPLATLPITTLSCALTLGVLLVLTGWWRRIRWGPAVASGLATAVILLASTLAYSLPAVSVLVMATLMKGGVLLLAPLVDVAQGRRVGRPQRVALALAGAAVAVSCTGRVGIAPALPAAALAVVGAYLAGYAVKLRLLGRRKRDSGDDLLSFAVTESAVTVSAALAAIVLALVWGVGVGLSGDEVPWWAWHLDLGWRQWARGDLWAAGALSQGTGVFGAAILLGRQAHAHCVTLNRASGVLAGVAATLAAGTLPGAPTWVGAGLILCAVAALSTKERLSS